MTYNKSIAVLQSRLAYLDKKINDQDKPSKTRGFDKLESYALRRAIRDMSTVYQSCIDRCAKGAEQKLLAKTAESPS